MADETQTAAPDPALKHLERFDGGWRPNPGADESVNVPHDIGGHRID